MGKSAGIEGVLAALTINGAACAESQNFSLRLGQALVDLTNRDSAYWRQLVSSTREWSISGDGLYIYNNVAKKVLVAHWSTRIPAELDVILTLADGTITVSGKALLESLEFPAPHAGPATITFTLQGIDVLTISES